MGQQNYEPLSFHVKEVDRETIIHGTIPGSTEKGSQPALP
jgi:hypothetical protein